MSESDWFDRVVNDTGIMNVLRDVSLAKPFNSQGASFMFFSVGGFRSDQPPLFGDADYDLWNKTFNNVHADPARAVWNRVGSDTGARHLYVESLQRNWRYTSRVFYVNTGIGFFRCVSLASHGTAVNWDVSGIRVNQNGFAYNTSTGSTETGSTPLTVGTGNNQILVQAWTRNPIVTTRTVYDAGLAGSAYFKEANSYWNRAMVGTVAPDSMTDLTEYTGLPSTAYSVGDISANKESQAVIKYLKQPPSGSEYNLVANINVPAGIVVSNDDDTAHYCLTTDFNHFSYYFSNEVQSSVNIPWGWFKDITVNAVVDGSIITAKTHREGRATGVNYAQALVIGVPDYGGSSAQGTKTFNFNLDLTNGDIDNTTFGSQDQESMFAILVYDANDSGNYIGNLIGGLPQAGELFNGRRATWTLNITGGLAKLLGRKIKYQPNTTSVAFLNTGKPADETYIVGYDITSDLNDALAEELSSSRTTRTNLTAVYLNDAILVDSTDYTFDTATKQLVISASVNRGDVVEIIH